MRTNFDRVIVELEHKHHDDITGTPGKGCAGTL